MNARSPATSAPTGQPSPFVRHRVTESYPRGCSWAGAPEATTAFLRRGPSMWVRGPFQDDRVAGLGVRLHRDLVGHRRGREVERRLLAEERRHPVLKRVDRRILLPLLVPDGRLRHEPPHACGWARRGIAAEIDERGHRVLLRPAMMWPEPLATAWRRAPPQPRGTADPPGRTRRVPGRRCRSRR